ncbi:MAG: hypothetical protein J5J04_17375 [Anaerolineae bacterium]|nr:hypothetical protein [Chloroflexota bacterium]MCO6445845.1 hypothetical protein [Anaerolineae bacterium]MDL1917371.1 hypothetical protein [Anaerolineae bacterium CFX4]OQY83242.1 MAG: hypothetical protein B6D42_07980 [Anaerolineae bacterium UTCFX5]MEB2367231.1 hypothetical protein [Chloroflexota bacterium]
MLDQAAITERRRQLLRVILVGIIFTTVPFYCLGFFLWGTAPQRTNNSELPTATTTLLGASATLRPTQFPTLPIISSNLPPLPTLQPTPIQIFPPVVNPPTRVLSLTPVVIPSSTLAPTLTFPPTDGPPTTSPDTPLPPPSDTPSAPDDVDPPPPFVTNTPPVISPTGTDGPPGVLMPPTDTPSP